MGLGRISCDFGRLAVIGVFILAMGVTGYLVDDPTWRSALMLGEIGLLLAVIVRTYDKNARTGV